MSIQVFACDHRKNIDWKLPFIRIGGQESDCSINIKDDTEIAPYSILLSEGAKIWWVWKNLAQFGNPTYIGFCHYRRFFGNAPRLIYDIPEDKLGEQKIFSPFEQYSILEQNKLDGLVPVPLCPLPKSEKYNYSNIIEQTKMISDHDGLGFTTEVVDECFRLLLKNTPEELKSNLQNAFLNDKLYVCNIFTMRTMLFQTYGEIISKTMLEISKLIETKDTSKFHPRWMGYVLERFTSCIIQAFQMSGHKFSVCPLITVDGWKHEPFEKHVGE